MKEKILLQSTAVGPFLLGIMKAEFILETNYPSNTNYPSEMDKLFASSINSANDQGLQLYITATLLYVQYLMHEGAKKRRT